MFIKNKLLFGLVLITIQQAVGSEGAAAARGYDPLAELDRIKKRPFWGSDNWEDKKKVARAALAIFNHLEPLRRDNGYDRPIEISCFPWLSEDPIGLSIVFNLYQFSLKTPWNNIRLSSYRQIPGREQQAEYIKKIQEIVKCGYLDTRYIGMNERPVGVYDKLSDTWETVTAGDQYFKLAKECRGRDDRVLVGEDMDPTYEVFNVKGIDIPKIASKRQEVELYRSFGVDVGVGKKEEIIAEAHDEWPRLLNELAQENLK